MMLYKFIFAVWWLLLGLPALSYAKYLHDDADNPSGAAMVAFMFVLGGVGVYLM